MDDTIEASFGLGLALMAAQAAPFICTLHQ